MTTGKNFKIRRIIWLFALIAFGMSYCAKPVAAGAEGYITQNITVTAERAPMRIGAGDMFIIADYAARGESFKAHRHYVDASGNVWFEVAHKERLLWIPKKCCRISNSLGEIKAKSFSRKKPPRIYISPSRQPHNKYAVGDTNEMQQMEALATVLAEVLRTEYRCEVYVAPSYMRIIAPARPSDAAAKDCDIYLALHSNASSDGRKHAGAEAYYYSGSVQSKQLAESIVRELNAASDYPVEGAVGAVSAMEYFDNFGYGEVRDPSNLGLIAVLAEVDYHDNPITARRIIGQKKEIAQALANAVGNLLQ